MGKALLIFLLCLNPSPAIYWPDKLKRVMYLSMARFPYLWTGNSTFPHADCEDWMIITLLQELLEYSRKCYISYISATTITPNLLLLKQPFLRESIKQENLELICYPPSTLLPTFTQSPYPITPNTVLLQNHKIPHFDYQKHL